jgi:hypothetical protein
MSTTLPVNDSSRVAKHVVDQPTLGSLRLIGITGIGRFLPFC